MAKSKAKKLAEEKSRAKSLTEHWILVEKPWFPSHWGRHEELSEGTDLPAIAWWLQRIFGKGKVKFIQYQKNIPRIVVAVELKVDIKPQLGRHFWAKFLDREHISRYEVEQYSDIFEYNYIKYGDQSEKGKWHQYYPLPRDAPHNFPVSSPYPLGPPVWLERFESHPVMWALPIERPQSDIAINLQPAEYPNLNTVDSQAQQAERSSVTPTVVDRSFKTSDPRIRQRVLQTPASTQPLKLSPPPPIIDQRPPSRPDHRTSHISTEVHQSKIGPSTRTAEPPIPLGTQSARTSATFRPYQPPSHLPSHPLTLLDNSVNPTTVCSPSYRLRHDTHDLTLALKSPLATASKDGNPVKREPSPIRVPYVILEEEKDEKKVKRDPSPDNNIHPTDLPLPTVPEEEKPASTTRGPPPSHVPNFIHDEDKDEKKVKRDPSPIVVPYVFDSEEGDEPKYNASMKKPQEGISLEELTYPDSDIEDMRDPESVFVKLEPEEIKESPMWLSPRGELLNTQLVLIQHPFGITFPPQLQSTIPIVSEAWDWLQLIADGALALYFDLKSALSPEDNWTVARLGSQVDLNGILGQHRWAQILQSCPTAWNHDVSTITLYLEDPERRLRRMDAPGNTENYEKFAIPYPAPHALPEGFNANVVVAKRPREDDITDHQTKRIKSEIYD